jgi:hypothetical protein
MEFSIETSDWLPRFNSFFLQYSIQNYKACIPKTSNSGNFLLFACAREGTLRFGYHSNNIIL